MVVFKNVIGDEPAAFVEQCGWADATAHPLAGDASTRRYLRLEKAGASALLMIAPAAAEAAACPPEASAEERKALGYNARARLAGPNLGAFTAIAGALRGVGLSAPEIYAADPALGLAILEDLGDDLFARIADGANERALYQSAVDVLLHLRADPPPRPAGRAFLNLEY